MFFAAPAGFGASTLAGLSGAGALGGGAITAGGVGGAAAAGGGALGAAGPLAAMGPLGLAAAGLTAGANVFGAIQQQKAMDKAITQAEEGFVRNFGVGDLMAERDKARQLAATREGHSFMNSPVFQQVADKKFGQEYALAGKLAGKYFNPYVFGQIDKFT